MQCNHARSLTAVAQVHDGSMLEGSRMRRVLESLIDTGSARRSTALVIRAGTLLLLDLGLRSAL